MPKIWSFIKDNILQLLVIALLTVLGNIIIKVLYRIIRIFISGYLERPLQQVVNDWSLVLLLLPLYSIIFFAFTAGFTHKFTFTYPLNQSNGYFWWGYWKDLVLLNIIAALYIGTFKLTAHRATGSVFKSPRDFLIFAAACSVIAVMAIHAEFVNAVRPLLQSPISRWQQLMQHIHVNIRDIGFLLLPIAIYLFWIFRCVVRDIADGVKNPAKVTDQ